MTEDEQYIFDIQKEWTENEANNLCKLYMAEGNGLQIWRALREMHEAKLPIPPSIIAKFVEWSFALEKANSPAEICQALELAGGDKNKLGLTRAKQIESHWRLAGKVTDLIRLFKISKKQAIELVARDTGKSVHIVHKIYFKVTSGKPKSKITANKSAMEKNTLDSVMHGAFGR